MTGWSNTGFTATSGYLKKPVCSEAHNSNGKTEGGMPESQQDKKESPLLRHSIDHFG
jgi:hypothetical protein